MDYEKIESNWSLFQSLASKLSDERLDDLLEQIGERLVICPAAPRTEYSGCYPGGLIDHALKVTNAMRSIASATDTQVSVASVLKVGLLHELGKVGDMESDYFVDQDSDWHREKLGQHYKYNEDLKKMSVSHRTLWLLQSAGVKLTADEWEAIVTSQGLHIEENRFYAYSENPLVRLLHAARLMVVMGGGE